MTYKQITGYEGIYWINKNGMVMNKHYKIIKLTQNNKESSNYYSRTFLWSCDKL